MQKSQVLLREDQVAALQTLSRRTGRDQIDLIRHGVDLALAEAANVKAQDGDWREAFRAAAGMWADRTDLDELYADRRKDSARRAEELEKHWWRPYWSSTPASS